MRTTIKNIIKRVLQSNDGRTLVANFGYLSILQIAGYIFPLITLPYLARTIGVDGFGKIAFASAIMIWFQTFVDWGFNFTATRDVARNRDNEAIVSDIFSTVFWARCLLMIVSLIILLICILCLSKLRENTDVLLVTFLMIPGHIMFPDWFFQAVERMKYITYLNLFLKLLFTIAVFIFIKNENDYILQPLFTSLGYAICGLISMFIIIKKWGIRLKIVNMGRIVETIKLSTDVFINNIFPNFYKAFSTILLGFVGGTAANGVLDVGIKFETIVNQFLNIISRVFYPFLSRRMDKHELYSKLNMCLACFASILLFIGAPILVRIFFTEEFFNAIPVLRLLSISIPFLALSNIYGTNYLIVRGFDRELRKITISCSIFGFIIAIILVPLYSYYGAAITILITRVALGIWSMIKVWRINGHREI